MDDPTLQAGLAEIESDLRSQWENTIWSRKRDRIWHELKHLRQLRQKLASFAGASRD
jgi:hypothetical protein